MKLLLATANPHKIREIEALVAGSSVQLVSLRDYPTIELPEETGTTIAANALLKAEHCTRETGLPALADDSGIEVDFLNGEPGVYSARWVEGSDADRTQAILDRLTGVPDADRTARYRCVICVTYPGGEVVQTEGTCEGKINQAPRGTNGFGYDPIFEVVPATGTTEEWIGHTMAEVPPEVKAQVSHRARALRQMIDLLS